MCQYTNLTINVLIYQYANILMYQYTNMPLYIIPVVLYINVPRYQYAYVSIYQCTNTPVLIQQYINILIYHYTSGIIHRCTNVSVYWYTNMLVYWKPSKVIWAVQQLSKKLQNQCLRESIKKGFSFSNFQFRFSSLCRFCGLGPIHIYLKL